MANRKVEIKVKANANKVYICGNILALGAWNPAKAVELKLGNDGFFSVTKMLPENQMIEFKILSQKSWEYVEKTNYDEEVANHIFVLPNEEPLIFIVEKFNK